MMRMDLSAAPGRALRAAALAGLLALAGCTGMFTDSGVTVTKTGERMAAPVAVPEGTDPSDEVIGRREHPRILAAYGGVYSDRTAEVMLARMVGRLLSAADQGNSFTVTILDSPEVNAFALPGGYVYVTRGILALANDSSELAAVLAHEISHVTLRHARARSSRTRTTELVDRIVTGVFGGDAQTDQGVARSRVSLAAFSQQQELAADKEGVLIMGRAGYDPHAAARFLGAMSRFAGFSSGTETGDDFLSSHPSTPDRIEKAMEAARSAFGPPGTGESGRAEYLNAIKGLTFGESPRQGAVVGQKFVHPDLGFTFSVPNAYRLENAQNAVIAVAGDGEAARFDSAEVPASMDLQDYLKSGWIAGLRPETVTASTVNGIPMASGQARTDQWAFRVHVLRFSGKVYRFIFAARSDTEAFARAARDTVGSFRPASDADIAGIRRISLDVVVARPGENADTLAARMSAIAGGRELFYVLNNLYRGDPVVPGALYKIVTAQ